MRAVAEFLSTGTSTELDTHGREAALLAPILIREDLTQPGKCCVSSSSIRAHSSQVRVSPFVAPMRSRQYQTRKLSGGRHHQCVRLSSVPLIDRTVLQPRVTVR